MCVCEFQQKKLIFILASHYGASIPNELSMQQLYAEVPNADLDQLNKEFKQPMCMFFFFFVSSLLLLINIYNLHYIYIYIRENPSFHKKA